MLARADVAIYALDRLSPGSMIVDSATGGDLSMRAPIVAIAFLKYTEKLAI